MRKDFIFFGLAFIIVVIDQAAKFLAASRINFSESVPVIEGFFHLTLVRNFGIGFGLFSSPAARWFFVFIIILIILLILYYYRAVPEKYFPVVSLALVLGGAVGNLIDRVLLGFVVDFIDFRFWPAFNVADSAVTIGVIGLIIYFWQAKK